MNTPRDLLVCNLFPVPPAGLGQGQGQGESLILL